MRIWSRRYTNLNWRYTFYSNLRESPIIKKTDTEEDIKKKIKKEEERRIALRDVKREKFDEMVSLLDIFQGQLTLTDVLNQDIPVLNALKEAKIRLNAEIMKERQKNQK